MKFRAKILDMNPIDKNPGRYILPNMTPKDLAPDSMDMTDHWDEQERKEARQESLEWENRDQPKDEE